MNKLQLTEKFLRRILYTRRDALRLGLIKLKTAINILVTKLYIRYLRASTSILEMIEAINQKVFIKKGLNTEE